MLFPRPQFLQVSPFAGICNEIKDAMQDGLDLDEIDETIIAPADVTTELKAALWLYGFSLQSPRTQRRFVHETLEVLSET